MKFVLDRKRASMLIYLCFILYSSAYIGRYSYAANLLNITENFGVDKDLTGMVSSFFFFSYASGQLLNAWLSRYYEPKRVITVAMLVSAVCNLCIGLLNNVELMRPVWLVNGIAQSMLWCSLLNTQAKYLSKKDIGRAIIWNSMTIACGTVISYGLSSLFARFGISWRVAFYITAAIVASTALLWWFGLSYIEKLWRDKRGVISNPDLEEIAPQTASPEPPKTRLYTRYFIPPFIFTCIAAASGSFIRDGVVTWLPTILYEDFGVDKSLSIALTMILPLISLLGAFLVRFMQRRFKGNMVKECILFVGVALSIGAIIALYPNRLTVLTLVCFALMYLLLCAINNITTSVIPFACRSYGNVGSTSALLDACCYVGSVCSAYGLGAVAEQYSWMSVIHLTAVVAAAAIIICAIATLLVRRDAQTKNIL